MAEILGYPLGVCATHGPKLAVNGVPVCIKCKAKEDNADRVMVVSSVQDPGEDYFKSGKVNPQVVAAQPKAVVSQAKTTGYTLESGLQEILNVLAQIPMPSSMKQYKLLLHVKQKIESAIQEG